MSVTITIDNKKITVEEGTTILNAATQNGIKIPNLCYDGRVELYGACGLCVVEVEGSNKLLRSCSAKVQDGMIVNTQTERVKTARKVALELLLSDHTGDCKAPCSKACPAGTDCQGYVGLIANGEYKEAVKLIKEQLPIPASIGRICPHPCEKMCRRQYVDEPISIAFLKSFVADMDLNGDTYEPTINEDSGKSVAVIGGGPAGLCASYYLRAQGHKVTIYEQMEKMGGMLRYGIPEYRLPKKVLQKEIDLIESMGITFKNNVNIGKDITLKTLKNQYDAVLVAIGAWNSSKMRVEGENLQNVWGGIDLLRKVAMGERPNLGKNVAVCGGGNTAMDACRTAVRLGAENVYVIYRRTRDEMPADKQEILESEEEGVTYKFLTNPIEFKGENGVLKGALLQKMRLGEPDQSGRRRPEPIEGETEYIDLDSVIMAIGQYPNLDGFESLESTRRNTILADECRFTTSVEGVFAVGDATNKGADIAIAAIGEAHKAANIIDRYLDGEIVAYKKPYFVERDSKSIDYSGYKKAERVQMPQLEPSVRKNNFVEVNKGITEEMAQKEAMRCLECGCHDYFECKLVKYANQYDVEPQRFNGEKHSRNTENQNDLISRNSDKCILCGLCVRVCDEVMGKSALGLINRGFNTIVEPELNKNLADTDCIMCGQCVALCPTGALRELTPLKKRVPLKENSKKSICTLCSNLCDVDYRFIGSRVLRALPYGDKGILCKEGRFGLLSYDYSQSSSAEQYKNGVDEFLSANVKKAIVVGDSLSAEILFAVKNFANENNIPIYTTATEKSADYYFASRLSYKSFVDDDFNSVLLIDAKVETKAKCVVKFSRKCENSIHLNLPYSENGTYADKYGNVKYCKAFIKVTAPNFAEFINSLCKNKVDNLQKAVLDEIKPISTGSVEATDIINCVL